MPECDGRAARVVVEGRLELRLWLVRRPPHPTRPGAHARRPAQAGGEPQAGWAPPEGASRESVADVLCIDCM